MAHRCISTAILNRWNHCFVQNRAVCETIDTVGVMFAEPRRDILAARDDNIRAKRRDQFAVGIRRIGDHREALALCQLNDVAAIGASSTRYCQNLTRREVE